jgi:hypothetical protein
METADRWRKKVAACRSPDDSVRPPAENLLTTPWKYRVIGRRACKTSCPLRGGRLPIVPYDGHRRASCAKGIRWRDRQACPASFGSGERPSLESTAWPGKIHCGHHVPWLSCQLMTHSGHPVTVANVLHCWPAWLGGGSWLSLQHCNASPRALYHCREGLERNTDCHSIDARCAIEPTDLTRAPQESDLRPASNRPRGPGRCQYFVGAVMEMQNRHLSPQRTRRPMSVR